MRPKKNDYLNAYFGEVSFSPDPVVVSPPPLHSLLLPTDAPFQMRYGELFEVLHQRTCSSDHQSDGAPYQCV